MSISILRYQACLTNAEAAASFLTRGSRTLSARSPFFGVLHAMVGLCKAKALSLDKHPQMSLQSPKRDANVARLQISRYRVAKVHKVPHVVGADEAHGLLHIPCNEQGVRHGHGALLRNLREGSRSEGHKRRLP